MIDILLAVKYKIRQGVSVRASYPEVKPSMYIFDPKKTYATLGSQSRLAD